MTDAEAQEVYDELIETLRSLELNWLADQISREVAEGKTTFRVIDVRAVEETDLELAIEYREPRQSRPLFAQVQQYSAKEKLLLLTTALRAIVVSSARIPTSLQQHLQGDSDTTILVASDIEQPRVLFSAEEATSLNRGAEHLSRYLEGLERRIELSI